MLLLAAGCAAIGPDPDDRPAIFAEGEAASADTLASQAFWAAYRDPVLNELIARGLKQNLDEAAARERIRAAAADLRGTGVLAAQASGSADASRKRGSTAGAAVQNVNASSLGAGFVFDLFGGARRERQGARTSLESAKADLGTARLAWIAELIGADSDARYDPLALTRQMVSSHKETVRIIREQREFGVVSEFDMAQAEALLAAARAELPGHEAQFDAQVFAIATLLNQPASWVQAQMRRGSRQPRSPGSSRAGLPADLLRNRPDLRSAEYDLAALALLDLLDSDRPTASARLSAASARNQAAKEWAALQIATGAGAGEVVLVGL
ncbi:TolC family protein [Paracoccus sp. pheM1]|nr:TolC family protein [Paracoccus sp. pheM1]